VEGADLPIRELVENQRRSIAMLPPRALALNRDEPLETSRQVAARCNRFAGFAQPREIARQAGLTRYVLSSVSSDNPARARRAFAT
jgi:hypothetical protein